ncbi:hypothetical protein J6590_003052 [Homalodisca vitripennis]|nr:hypothetical protein J6590_003052 [Homalodisca vitripennis]
MTLSLAVKQIGHNEDKKGIRLVILLQLPCLVILVCLIRMTLSPAVKQIGVRCAETVVHDSCLRSSSNEDKKGIRLVILLQLPCLVILVCLTRMTLSPAVKQIGVRCAETVVHDSCLRSSNNEDKKGIRLVILLQLPWQQVTWTTASGRSTFTGTVMSCSLESKNSTDSDSSYVLY